MSTTIEQMTRGMHEAVANLKKSNAPPKAESGAEKLRSLVDRIVRLEEEKAEAASAIKDIYAEAKSAGYSAKALRIIVKREMETAEQREKREQTESDVDVMIAALGDFGSSPLGDDAVRRAAKALDDLADEDGVCVELQGSGKTIVFGKKARAEATAAAGV